MTSLDNTGAEAVLQERCFQLMASGHRSQESFQVFAEIAKTATVKFENEDFE